jgi:hypothetical protein
MYYNQIKILMNSFFFSAGDDGHCQIFYVTILFYFY